MEDFLKDYFKNTLYKTEPLPGDGGHRLYTRIKTDEDKSYILMSCGKKDKSLEEFVSVHSRLKKADCHVPDLYAKDLSEGLLLLEDLGNKSLEMVHLDKKKEEQNSLYQKSLEQLLCLQKTSFSKEKDSFFDKDFFTEEVLVACQRFEDFFKVIFKDFKEEEHLKFKEEMKQVISQIIKTKYVYCHRDFHSKNIMIKTQKSYLLDFQDAGVGPWMYDLTSLLYDSYIEFTDRTRKDFIKFYFDSLPDDFQKEIGSFKEAVLLTRLQFLQRGFKACGCFAFFYTENNKTTHLKYIRPTLSLLVEVAMALNYEYIADYFMVLNQKLDNPVFFDLYKGKSK